MRNRNHGGLIGNTNPQTLTFESGVWSVNEVADANTTNTWVDGADIDPYYNYVAYHQTDIGPQDHILRDTSGNQWDECTVTNRSTNGNLGRYIPTQFSPTNAYWASQFNGNDKWMQVNDAPQLRLDGLFTIEFWINVGDSAATEKQILGKGPSATLGWAVTQNASRQIVFYDQASPITSTVILARDTWYHVAIVRQTMINTGSNLQIFINGSLSVSGQSSTQFNEQTTFYIGAGRINATPRFGGSISDLRITQDAIYPGSFIPPTAPLSTYPASSPSTRTCSTYFNGAVNRLTAPASAAFDLSGGNYSIDMWIFPTWLPINQNIRLFQVGTNNTANSAALEINVNASIGSGSLKWWVTTGTPALLRSQLFEIQCGTWQHVGVSCIGGVATLFINGRVAAGPAVITQPTAGNVGAIIGADGVFGNAYQGFISDLRVINGVNAITNFFTVPAAPSVSVPGTALLTCQQGDATDASPNSFIMTPVLQVPSSAFTPWQPYYNNNGTGSGSIQFNGTSDFLQVGNLAAGGMSNLNFFNNDFTVETYFKVNVITDCVLYDQRPTGTNGAYLMIQSVSSKIQVYFNTATKIAGLTTIIPGVWYHIAVTRRSGVMTLWVNGAADQLPISDNTSFISGAYRPLIGMSGFSATAYFSGYMSNLRVQNGIALYTVPFTPPVTHLNDIGDPTNTDYYTRMLLHFDGANNSQILDSTYVSNPTPFGLAAISNAQSMFGGSSLSLDGTNSYITSYGNPGFKLGYANWTIETFVYLTAMPATDTYPTTPTIYQVAGTGTTTTTDGFDCFIGATTMFVQAAGVKYGAAAHGMTTNTWYHIAYVRVGGNITFYVDGVNKGYIAYTGEIVNGNSFFAGSRIGTSCFFKGFMDEMRITVGQARYTTAFSRPIVPFTLGTTITSLLIGNYSYADNSQTQTPVYPGQVLSSYSTGHSPFPYAGSKIAFHQSMVDNGYDDIPSSNTTGVFVMNPCYPTLLGTGANASQRKSLAPFADTDSSGNGSVYFNGGSDSYVQLVDLTASGANNMPLLLHFDTTIAPDSSAYKHTPQTNGVSVMAMPKFGATSAFFPLTSGNENIVYTGLSDEFNLYGIDFTFDCWIRPLSFTGTIFSNTLGSSDGYAVSLNSTGHLVVTLYGTDSSLLTYTSVGTVALNVYTHICFVRCGISLYLGIGGTMETVSANYMIAISSPTKNLMLGNATAALGKAFNGYIDEFRFVRGQAVWVVNYTPPTVAYTTPTGANQNTNGSLQFRDGPFTVEAWIYTLYSTYGICNKGATAAAGWNFGINAQGNLTWSDGATIYTSNQQVGVLSWMHVAIVRQVGGLCTFYINGMKSGTFQCATSYTGADNLQIGCSRVQTQPFNGWMSNFRISRAAMYTSSFTPSPILTVVPGATSYLAFKSPYAQDSQIIDTGIARNPYVSTSAEWRATPGPQNRTGWSLDISEINYSYMRVSYNSNWLWGTGDFSYECFVFSRYNQGPGDTCIILDTRGSDADAGMLIRTNDTWTVEVFTSGQAVLVGKTRVETAKWYHICVQRVNGVMALYINGKMEASCYWATAINAGTDAKIGGSTNTSCWWTKMWYGYISNIRLCKGAAAYEAGIGANAGNPNSFVVPNATLTTIPNTVFLGACGPTLMDYTMPLPTVANDFRSDMSPNGSWTWNYRAVPFGPFTAGQAFDNNLHSFAQLGDTADNINVYEPCAALGSAAGNLAHAWISHGVQPFTIEGWCWTNQQDPASGTAQALVYTGYAATHYGWSVQQHGYNVGSYYYCGLSFNIFGGTASAQFNTTTYILKANSWNHWAITFTGTTYNLYVNGVRYATQGAQVQNPLSTTTYPLSISKGCGGVRISTVALYTGATHVVPPFKLLADANTHTCINMETSWREIKGTVSSLKYGTALPSYKYKKFGNGSIHFPQIAGAAVTDRININETIWPSYSMAVQRADFTLEFWASWGDLTAPGTRYICGLPTYISIGCSGGTWYVLFPNWTAPNYILSTIPVAKAPLFDHVCLVLKKHIYFLFINGVLAGTFNADISLGSAGTVNRQTMAFDTQTAWAIGADAGLTTANSWIGYVEDFRWTGGVARYDVASVNNVSTMVHTGTTIPALPTGPYPTR